MSKVINIGVFLTDTMWKNLNLKDMTPDKYGIKLTPIDFNSDLSSFDGIIHKFTYQFTDGHESDVERFNS